MMISDIALLGLAACNVALIAILARAAYTRTGVPPTHRWLVPLLMVITACDVVASALHAGWAITVPLMATDLALVGIIYRLMVDARRLQAATSSAHADIAWRREEQQRALHDRCANLF